MVFRGPKLIVGSKEIVATERSLREACAVSVKSHRFLRQPHRDRKSTMWPPYNRSTFSDKGAHPRSLARIFAICTHTHTHTHTHTTYIQ